MDKQHRLAAFAKRFTAALDRSGLGTASDGDLVKRLARQGVSVTSVTVSNWRSGKHMPNRLEHFEAAARMLGMEPGELAFGKPRIAESQAAWVTSAGDRAVLDDLALLGAEEREALAVLIRLLRPRGKRPGRRRKLPQS